MILGKSYLGTTEASKVYLGATQVYPTAPVGIEFYNFGDFGAPITSLATETATMKTDYPDAVNGAWRIQNASMVLSGVGQADTTTAQLGNYCARFDALRTFSSANQLFSPDNLIIGKTYKWTIWVKQGTSTDAPRWASAAGFTDTFSEDFILDGAWHEYTKTTIATDTVMRIFIYCNDTSGVVGDSVYVDNCSILQID